MNKVIKRAWWIIPAFIATLSYLITIKFGLIWDDFFAINYEIKGIASRGWQVFLGASPLSYFRPMVSVLYYLNYVIFEFKPWGYHLTNILLNSLAVLFVTLIVYEFYKNKLAAFFGGLIFALHPCHVESVAWISGRTDLLSGLFFFWGFWTYTKLGQSEKNKDPFKLIWVSTLFLLSSLSKEVGLSFILVIFFYELLVVKKIRWKYLVILLIPLIVYVGLKFSTFLPSLYKENSETAIIKTTHNTFLWYPITPKNLILYSLNHLGYYIEKLLFPLRLTVFSSNMNILIYKICFGIFYIVFVVWTFFKQRKWAFFNMWFVSTLAPAFLLTVFIVAATPVAERYLFIPSAALAFGISDLWIKIDKLSVKIKKSLRIIVVLYLMFFAVRSWTRMMDWKSNYTLWKSTISSDRDFENISTIPYQGYAAALFNLGKVDSAMKYAHLAYSHSCNPGDSSTGAYIIGYILRSSDKLDSAIYWCQVALHKSAVPKKANIYTLLGDIYLEKYQLSNQKSYLDSAGVFLKKSFKIAPNVQSTNYNLALFYFLNHKMDSTIFYLERTVDLNPYTPLGEKAREILSKVKTYGKD